MAMVNFATNTPPAPDIERDNNLLQVVVSQQQPKQPNLTCHFSGGFPMPRIHRENNVISTTRQLFSEDDTAVGNNTNDEVKVIPNPFLEMALQLALTATTDTTDNSSNDRSSKPSSHNNTATTSSSTTRNKRSPKMSSFPMPRLKQQQQQQQHFKYHPYSLQSYDLMWRTIRTTTDKHKREVFMRKIQRGYHHRRRR